MESRLLSVSLRNALHIAVGLAAATFTVGCGSALKMNVLNHSARRPSNVAVYFTVDTRKGEPVPGLTSEKFVIYEDGSKVSEFESKQTILNPTIAASHYTLLLLDMSGSIVESGKSGDVVAAASKFTERLEKYQRVGVAAFDGSPELTPVVPFTDSGKAAQGGIERLATYKPKDPSTNLHGAVVEGLKLLKRSLAADPKPLKFGTLVVFTDGTDRAGRVSREDLKKAIDGDDYKSFEIYAIGVGAELEGARLGEIGRNGTIQEPDPAKLDQAFEQVSARIAGATQRYYLLSYCSPSRAGEHEVRIEAKTENGSGELTYKFKADGFGPSCDPNTPPDFDMSRPVEPKSPDGNRGTATASASMKVGVK